MPDTGTPPVIPADLKQYDSYTEDPKWQIKFSIVWSSFLALFILLSLPNLVRAIRAGRAFNGVFFGVTEDLSAKDYMQIKAAPGASPVDRARKNNYFYLKAVLRRIKSIVYWSPPGIGLNLGQIVVVIGYITTVVLCIVLEAPLLSNSNRAGFIALAQFPVVFLFATKNSVVSLLLGPGAGYEKLNFIHRWSGRCMFFGAVLHGSLWINNHLVWDLPIIGQQKETSGVAALGLLCVIVLTSLRPLRRRFYDVFFVIHVLGYVAFFITICYHTIYASPWIFPPLAFYGLDLLLRMLRYRIKDAFLVPVDTQMTLIHIPYCSDGWTAGQHIRLRVFFSGRIFESHPMTISSAPPSISCLDTSGMTLGARVAGDWTRALNNYAIQVRQEALTSAEEKGEKSVTKNIEVPVQVMIDGPYGGCSIDIGRYENVLLFAGGSGATFTLGLLDDIVGRCVRQQRRKGEITRRIEFAWCVRSFGSIEWFTSALMDIATAAADAAASSPPLYLHISIYVTCLCNPEAIPPIPNSDVTIIRPSIFKVLFDLTSPPRSTLKASDQSSLSSISVADHDTEQDAPSSTKLPWVGSGGGVAVCASGPTGLTREAANAVARLQMSGKAREIGDVALHTEVFTM